MSQHRRKIGDVYGRVGIEQVSVGPMLNAVAPWVTPIVEHLAAKDVTAHAPIMPVALGLEVMAAGHQVVEIRDFKGGVVEFRRYAWDRGEI